MNQQEIARIRQRLEEAFGEEAEAEIRSNLSEMSHGHYAITLYPRNHASWESVRTMCREVLVDTPDDMLVERIPHRFCAVTIFWGFTYRQAT